ncbi:hypothetical protein TNCV_850371 [Trichonephila clavipes]|uniref:Uncharacterized protein n=1 Tax=Trichonephila clavipes TaxID=2585209 RepID=A0A8X6V6S8_TRICX|nr:hypothetical protein TNCV_850371 [Trichonephila clavipes]
MFTVRTMHHSSTTKVQRQVIVTGIVRSCGHVNHSTDDTPPQNEGLPDAIKQIQGGCGNLVVKVSDRGWLVMSSSPVPLKTCRVGQRCTLNPSRAQTSSRWCSVVVRRGGASSGLVLVT